MRYGNAPARRKPFSGFRRSVMLRSRLLGLDVGVEPDDDGLAVHLGCARDVAAGRGDDQRFPGRRGARFGEVDFDDELLFLMVAIMPVESGLDPRVGEYVAAPAPRSAKPGGLETGNARAVRYGNAPPWKPEKVTFPDSQGDAPLLARSCPSFPERRLDFFCRAMSKALLRGLSG